ncbi:MAG: hypothetical protein CMH83_13655 [Nocardioides sp.]|nr:hypothetical protein [Nocardioides sp.]
MPRSSPTIVVSRRWLRALWRTRGGSTRRMSVRVGEDGAPWVTNSTGPAPHQVSLLRRTGRATSTEGRRRRSPAPAAPARRAPPAPASSGRPGPLPRPSAPPPPRPAAPTARRAPPATAPAAPACCPGPRSHQRAAASARRRAWVRCSSSGQG